MAAIDVSTWGFSGTPDAAIAGDRARGARTRRRSIWLGLARLLASASVASAMTNPEVSAMILVDRLERELDGR